MGCVSIPFRRLPHQPKLFVRLIDDYSSVKQFYAHAPNMDAVKQVAASFDYPAEPAPLGEIQCAETLGGLLNHYSVKKAA